MPKWPLRFSYEKRAPWNSKLWWVAFPIKCLNVIGTWLGKNLLYRCPAAAGVAVGALLSPAAIGEMRNREHVSDMCIWNCGSQGDHHHICWLRPSRPLKINRRGVLDSWAAAELRRCACGVRLGAVHYKFLLLVSPRKRRSKVQPLPAGVARISNEGPGDCLFWSLSTK